MVCFLIRREVCMALFENARARIDPAKANVLLGEIDTIRGLPGAREKYKETGAWKVRSSSIGRPDFDYERTVPEMRNIERQRLRVVERWMGRHGLMRLWMQYVYVRPVSQLDEDAAVMQSGNVVRVYEEPSTTQTVLHRVALGLVRGGEVYGTWEKRQDTYHPLPTDFEHESLTGVDSEEPPRSL